MGTKKSEAKKKKERKNWDENTNGYVPFVCFIFV